MKTLLRRRSARLAAALILATAVFIGDAPLAIAGQDQISPEWGAAGGPYADCGMTSTLLKQLRSGLPAQDEWLGRREHS